jgi:hypothetical protein
VYSARLGATTTRQDVTIRRIIEALGNGALVAAGPSATSYTSRGSSVTAVASVPAVGDHRRARCLADCAGFTVSSEIGFEVMRDDAIEWHRPLGATSTHAGTQRWLRRTIVDSLDDGSDVIAEATSDGIDLRWVSSGRDELLRHIDAYAARITRQPHVAVVDFPPAAPPFPQRPFADSIVVTTAAGRPVVASTPPGVTGCVSVDGRQLISTAPDGSLHLRHLGAEGTPPSDTLVPFGIATDYPSLHRPCVVGASGLAVIARLASNQIVSIGRNGQLPDTHWRVVWFTPQVQPVAHVDVIGSVVALAPDQSHVDFVRSGVVYRQATAGSAAAIPATSNVLDIEFLENGSLVTLTAAGDVAVSRG